jgi:hypothetical protein
MISGLLNLVIHPGLTDEERTEILRQSVKRELSFGTDEEAMSSPGNNIDPRTKRYDMSNDPYCLRRGHN